MIRYYHNRDIIINNDQGVAMKWQETVSSSMQELFEQHGYRRFEMSKFEEYDFYAENRAFLNSENILTFTGPDGKLLALKPDVTLSIVKNTKAGKGIPDRVYYNENVYRVKKGAKQFSEILQTGVEYIGDVDTYATLEVLLLAEECLGLIDASWILDISHMGFIGGLLDMTGLDETRMKRILKGIREKNSHEIHYVCSEACVDPDTESRLSFLASAYGSLSDILPSLGEFVCNARMDEAYRELEEICACLKSLGCADRVNLDFSVVNDMDYYNGIIFQGFIEGIPASVLSGGRYDNLVRKFGKDAGAIGFAVYLDLLDRFRPDKKEYDTDVLLIYGDSDKPEKIAARAESIIKGGERVIVRRSDAGDVRYRRTEAVSDVEDQS